MTKPFYKLLPLRIIVLGILLSSCGQESVPSLVSPTECNFYIPNVFSPNSNVNNSTFKPLSDHLKSMEFSIYDTWGTEIFYSDDLEIGWDGRNENGEVVPGFYTYRAILTCLNGNDFDHVGDVTLVL